MGRLIKKISQVRNIIGIDPGTKFGFAWLQVEGSKIHLIESGVWDVAPDSKMNEGQGIRFLMAERYIKFLLGKSKPDILAYEAVMAHRGTRAAHIYGGFEALLTMICEQKSIPYFSFVPSTVKKNVAGHGGASKDEVADALKKFFPKKYKTDDESDAVAIAITGARKQGWLEQS